MHRIQEHEVVSTLHLKVPFFDADPMRVVWHGNYVKYFEMARAELLSKCGCSYQDMESLGLLFPVVDLKVSYRRPLTVGDDIAVRAYILECENRLKVGYEIIDSKGALCCYGYTVQAAVTADTHELCLVIPEVVASRLRKDKAQEHSAYSAAASAAGGEQA